MVISVFKIYYLAKLRLNKKSKSNVNKSKKSHKNIWFSEST